MKILITGATGLVGSELVKLCLAQNIKVHYLTTRKNKLAAIPNCKGYYWNPEKQDIDMSCFEGVSVIVNLAGSTIAKRWSVSYKHQILKSRIDSIATLKKGLLASDHQVKQFVTASAIGIYPDAKGVFYEEEFNEIDNSFIGSVVEKWERASKDIEDLGITVAKIRIGLVLSIKGGAFPQLSLPIKYGLGAVFGKGEQWQSWIHIEDLAEIFLFVVKKEIEGVINGVAPNPVSHKRMIIAMAKSLKRPLFLPNIPRRVLEIILGEMAYLLFSSQRVSSKKIEHLGFNFKFSNLEAALLDLSKLK